MGQVNHRLIKPYSAFPWLLAKTICSEETFDAKHEVARKFFDLQQCCLSKTFERPLRDRVPNIGELLGGQGFYILKAAFSGSCCNIAVENGFARLKSGQKTARGRRDLSHTLASKNFLAEAKCAHVAALESFGSIEDTAENAQDSQDNETRNRRTYNGYTFFIASKMKSRIALPDETAEQCRKRTLAECTAQWRADTEEGERLRREWSANARNWNKAERNQNATAVLHHPPLQKRAEAASSNKSGLLSLVVPNMEYPGPEPLPQLAILPHDVNGVGAMSMGDKCWALAESTLETADAEVPSFVQTYSSRWRARAGGMLGATDEFPSTTMHVSCTEMYGFCAKTIANMSLYKHVKQQLRLYVSNLRHNQKGGPTVAVQHPFLMLKDDSQSEPQCFPWELKSRSIKK